MIIPAVDLIGGNVVRLYQGSYNQKTEYSSDPLKIFKQYVNDGAAFLHLVDLDGAKDPALRQLDLIAKLIKETGVPIETGGGIRTERDVAELLNIGAERVVIGSTAIKEPEMVKEWMKKYGPEHIVLALDININQNGKRVIAIKGWQESSGVEISTVINDFRKAGLIYVLCTDISRDGTLQGSNTNLYKDLHEEFRDIKITASGGIGSLDDIKKVHASGVDSVVLGRALLEGKFTVKEALKCWPNE